jgi:hypothetical protein
MGSVRIKRWEMGFYCGKFVFLHFVLELSGSLFVVARAFACDFILSLAAVNSGYFFTSRISVTHSSPPLFCACLFYQLNHTRLSALFQSSPTTLPTIISFRTL